MAILDYKIVRLSQEGRHVTALVRVYRGVMQDVDESIAQDGSQIVNRYVRIAKVAQRYYEYDVPRDMSREEFIIRARAFLNKKLITFAQTNGHSTIIEQQDISDLEAVSNEIEL